MLAFPNPELHIDVTSNFSVDEKLWAKYLDYTQRLCRTNIEHFMQYVSLDSGDPAQAKYIRHGLDFWRVIRRTEEFLSKVPERNSLTFIVTMSNLNILGLKKLLEHVLDMRDMHSTTYQRVWFDTPILRTPTWQSLQILPPVYASRLQDIVDWMSTNLETAERPFKGFKDYEVQRLQRVVDWMKEGSNLDPDYVIMQRADFYRFFNEHDKRRKTDFVNTFPAMREFWEECRYHAQN